MAERKKKGQNRFDMREVLELRSKIQGCKTNKQKLFRIFDDQDDVEKGNSKPEISATLYPSHVDKTGKPTTDGKILTGRAIQKFRRYIIQTRGAKAAIVPYSIKTSEGYLYFNMQTKEDYDTVIKVSQKVIDGIRKHLREFQKIIEMRAPERDYANEQYRQELREQILELDQALKKSKKKRGSRS